MTSISIDSLARLDLYNIFFPHRATGEDRDGHGLHQRGHADSGKSSQGNGTLLWSVPKILEKVSVKYLTLLDTKTFAFCSLK